MDELKQDVKELRQEIRDIAVTLARNTGTLEVHIRRTDLAEERITQVERWLLGTLGAILLAVLGFWLQ